MNKLRVLTGDSHYSGHKSQSVVTRLCLQHQCKSILDIEIHIGLPQPEVKEYRCCNGSLHQTIANRIGPGDERHKDNDESVKCKTADKCYTPFQEGYFASRLVGQRVPDISPQLENKIKRNADGAGIAKDGDYLEILGDCLVGCL